MLKNWGNFVVMSSQQLRMTTPLTVQVYVHNSCEATQSTALIMTHSVVAFTNQSEAESPGKVFYCKKNPRFFLHYPLS